MPPLHLLTTAPGRWIIALSLLGNHRKDRREAILPIHFVQPASRAARLWAYVRSLDNPVNGGSGRGVICIPFIELQEGLNRSERSVFRYLADAKAKGFIYSYRVRRGMVRIRYVAIEKVAEKLGLSQLGPVVRFPLEQLPQAKVKAAEGQLLHTQQASFWEMKADWGKFARGSKTAEELLSSDKVPGGVVITRGERLLYLHPHWRPFGAAQAPAAETLGVSTRTIQYRLSDSWREERGLEPLNKAQTAKQVYEDMPLDYLVDLVKHKERSDERFVFLGQRLFEVGTNLYEFADLQLHSQRRRKTEYRRKLLGKQYNRTVNRERRAYKLRFRERRGALRYQEGQRYSRRPEPIPVEEEMGKMLLGIAWFLDGSSAEQIAKEIDKERKSIKNRLRTDASIKISDHSPCLMDGDERNSEDSPCLIGGDGRDMSVKGKKRESEEMPDRER